MQNSIVTPVRNLVNPVDPDLNFIMDKPQKKEIDILVKNCQGFGALYATLIFKKF